MIPEDRALRRLAEAATKGRWRSCRNAQRPYKHIQFGHDENYTTSPLEAQDADYIAAAHPPAILALLDDLARVEKNLDVALQEVIVALCDCPPGGGSSLTPVEHGADCEYRDWYETAFPPEPGR